MNETVTIQSRRLTTEEYIDFLKRTDLGSQYPKERFAERIERLLRNVSISLVAQNENGVIVGVLLGLTDFAYWLYITDLGVDRAYEKQGIGTRLMKTAHEIAGGEKAKPVPGGTAGAGQLPGAGRDQPGAVFPLRHAGAGPDEPAFREKGSAGRPLKHRRRYGVIRVWS